MKHSGLAVSSFPKHIQDQIAEQMRSGSVVPSRLPDSGNVQRSRQETPIDFTVYGIPAPLKEHRFDQVRMWRFDFAWPAQKAALEVEGGVWVNGGHNRGSGFMKNMEKYNAATLQGWRVVKCVPETLHSLATLEMIRTLLA